MNTNRFAAIGAFLGGLAVILGAFGAHAIKDQVSASDLEIWNIGIRYHLVHAVALVALASSDKEGKYKTVYWLWIAGILIFGCSLYALALSHIKILGAITPIGGLCLIIGWLMLGIKLWKSDATLE
ncbi:MAG: DUF423 domain-containing protein [Armatimonadota bacterium]